MHKDFRKAPACGIRLKARKNFFAMRKIGRGEERKIKIQVVELKYSRVMENKFLGIRASQKSYPIKKSLFGICFVFYRQTRGSMKKLRALRA